MVAATHCRPAVELHPAVELRPSQDPRLHRPAGRNLHLVVALPEESLRCGFRSVPHRWRVGLHRFPRPSVLRNPALR
jgi:hypothetical protein